MTDEAPWTCPFCALLCDRYTVDTAAAPPTLRGSDCPRAHAALRAFDLRGPAATPQPQVDGAARTLDDAVDAAAAALRAARQPLIGGLVADVDGVRALYRLAAASGAILDHAHGDAMQKLLSALQDRGQYTATVAEVRERAALVVCVGTQPGRSMPEFWRRIGAGESGGALQRIVFLGAAVDPRLQAGAGIAVESIQAQGDLHDALSRLAAAVAGRRLRAGANDPAIDALAGALRASPYSVLVWEPAALDAHGAIAAEMIQRTIHTLNRSTRAAGFAIAGNDAGTTAQQVVTWLSGLPTRTRVSRESIVHEPVRYRTATLLADGSVDAVVWVSSLNPEPPAPAFGGGPRVVLGHPKAAASNASKGTVFIPVSTPGIGSDGHLFRCDNVVALPVRRLVDDGLPTVADVAGRIAAKLSSPMSTTTTLLRGGRVVDPTNDVDGVRDVHIRDGRIVDAPLPGETPKLVDCAGRIVMAGGVDLHTHIGGGKVNLARLLLPEDHRPSKPVDNPLELPSLGHAAPGTLHTGYRYAEMGYTAAFEPAMVFSNARHAHLEMGDVPIVDHGAYVMLGNDELFLEMLAQGEDFERIRDYVGFIVDASKSIGVKIVNPGGISAFKFNQRKLDLDEQHVRWGVTPRQVVTTLARAVHALGIPHPLHIHGCNLGVPGNIDSTLKTIEALEGTPAHLTHVQFHCYGTEGPKKFSSGADRLLEMLKQHRNISIDVGQIIFGQTVTASGDTMRQFANADVGNPRKWVGADIECDAGCGVVPFKYQEKSFVNALQWSIGLELFLKIDDPWRIALTTDHPNAGPFTSYPHLIRLLMDRSFRDEQLARLHPDVAQASPLRDVKRELTLSEIAILTRAGPAKLLGLKDRGHLGVGAAADIAVYRSDKADAEAIFQTPEWVFKDGAVVSHDGRLQSVPSGGVHFVVPEYDKSIEKRFAEHAERRGSVNPRYAPITRDELCRCCGPTSRLFPRDVYAAAES